MSHPADDALHDDATRYLLGEADAATVARLETRLRQDAGARAAFAALARLHGHLGEIGRRTASGDVDAARLLASGPPPAGPGLQIVRRPRMRRWVGLAVAAAALLALGIGVLSLAVVGIRTRDLIPTVAGVHGQVEVVRDGAVLAATDGLRLRAGDRITVADGATLGIALAGGTCALGGGSDAIIEAADELHRRLLLSRGSIDTDIAGHAPVAVLTPSATVAIDDAAALVHVIQSRTEVAVRRGRVAITSQDGSTRAIDAGQRWDTGSAAPPIACKE